jgi:Tol biopolymer transport system component
MASKMRPVLAAILLMVLFGSGPAVGGAPRKIVFVQYERDRSNTFAIDPNGNNKVRLTDIEAWESDAVLSPDGTKVAFTRCKQRCNIHVANADGTDISRLTSGPDIEQFPVWSPDGTRIAFSRGTDLDAGAALWVMDADGMNQEALTSDRWFNAFPSWSPDGTQLVFVRFLAGDYELFRVGADGAEMVRLTDNEGVDLEPQWSPDGKRILYSSQTSPNKDYELFTISPEGSDRKRLTRNDFIDEFAPKWSPLGDRIAFARCQGTTCHLLAMNADRSGKTRLVEGGVESFSFAWAPDGSQLALARLTSSGSYDVFTVDSDGAELRNLTKTGRKDEATVDW